MSEQFIRHYGLYISGPKYKEYGGDSTQLAREIKDPLRISFEIHKTITREPNRANIKIYNLSPDTEREIIQEGTQIVLSAGYSQPGVIFKGQVFQPLRNKENGTDYILALNAMDGDAYLNLGFLSGTILSNKSRREIASQILRESNIKLDSAQLDELPETNFVDGSSPKNERAKVIFGEPGKYLSNLSHMGNASFYIDNNEARFFNPIKQIGKDEAHLITTETGMVGMPHQIPYGVRVKCLLNPQIRLGDFIKIDNKSVILQDVSMGDTNYRAHLLNTDGVYRVIEIDYSGDYMGDNWFCEISAVTQAGIIPALMNGKFGFMMI